MPRPEFRQFPRLLPLLSALLLHPLIGCGPPPDTKPDASTPTDGGSTSNPDASTPTDGGSTPTDGGSTPTDGGSTPTDGGSTPTDGGSTPTDGGSTPTDGGSTPTDGGSTPAPATYGLKGEYFRMPAAGNRTFPASPDGTVLESNIDFNDLTGIFKQFSQRTENTLARWTGRLTAPETGDYTFYAIGDNGFRMFLNGSAVIDHWVPDWDIEQTSQVVHLEKGETRDFKMELFQDVGGANMYLRWSSATIEKQIVPFTAFTPPADFPVYPVQPTISQDGLRLTLDFDGTVTAISELLPHLIVAADTVAMPTASATIDAADSSLVQITLSEPVQLNQKVRVTFDGVGGMRVSGQVVPAFNRNAINLSTHRLLTSWGEQLDRNNPLPEYPRPQLARPQLANPKWLNLNGTWEFSRATDGQLPTFGQPLPQRILVPFPVESVLSGVERHYDHMFYRRQFTVPTDWQVGSGQRLMLNFGAVDYRARVWVNGQPVVTEHLGGYTAFSADITSALSGTGPQELVVAVTDTTGANQPKGKQAQNPSGIFYTPTSGIWQTVWLEPVPTVAIDSLVTTPNLQDGTLSLKVESKPAPGSATITAEARDMKGRLVGSVSGPANSTLTLPVADVHTWSPQDPYLYSLTVTLTDGTHTDSVESYFGMRSVWLSNIGGFQKLILNGKPIFSHAMLDQGFWPDGLNTAPSDAALRWDLQAQKDLGFNAVRKHIKVEPARWYYHADQVGLLVWQDFVSGFGTQGGANRGLNEAGRQAFISQGMTMMEQLHNYPSIVGWIVFNEGWGEWNKVASGTLTEQVKAADPSRWVNAHSGVNCCDSWGDSGKGDIIDHHDYENRDPPRPDSTRAAMDGEHGGFTLRKPGHLWPGAPTVIYSGVADNEALTNRYIANTQTFYLGAARRELSGAIYTQVTDVENELNGFYTYDRKVLKVDQARVRAINEQVIAAGVAAGTELTYPGQGRWPLSEGQGSVADDVEGNSDLNLRGGATWVTGVKGKALNFNGTTACAESSFPVLDTRNDYSVAAWVRMDKLPGNFSSAVSQDGRERENPFYLQYGDGGFAFSTPGGKRARYALTPELNRWYHLVGVRSGTENRLYVDGVLRGTVAALAGTESVGPLAVGRAKYNGNDVDFWAGSVDEVQAFGRALSATEVTDLYNSQKP